MVMTMRSTIDENTLVLRECLEKAAKLRYDLTSKCRYLEAWIHDLIATLNEHDIVVPPAPGMQFPGTPTSCASD
jgi:hypothetical protein